MTGQCHTLYHITGDVQVLDHAETVKQLSQQEALVTELQQQQAAHEASGQAAHKAKVCSCLVKWSFQQPTSHLQTTVNRAVTVNRSGLFMIA